MNTYNGQSAAKPLLNEEGSTTIETHNLKIMNEVEYTNKHSGKGKNLIIFIYALIDPITKHIRYVGKTNNIYRRYYQHIYDKSKSHKASWIKSLNGLYPEIMILDIVYENWEFWEEYWISQTKSWGFDLTNLTLGGIGHKGFKKSLETRKILSIKSKNRIFSEETRKKISKAKTGLKFSKQHLINLSNSHKGIIYPKGNYGKHQFKKIKQYKDDVLIKEWDSIKEAANFYNVNQSSISHCCSGRKLRIKGFVWKYS